MALAQRAFGTRPQTDPWGNPQGTDSYEEWYAQELARQKQEALMSQVQRQQPYYGPEGYAPSGVGPGGLGANNYPSGGTAIPPAFGSYFRGWGENAPQQIEPEKDFTPRPDDREKIALLDQHMETMKKGMAPKEAAPEGEKAIEVTRPVVVQASAVRTATQARDVLRKADKNTIVLDGMSDFGFLSDRVIIVPGAGGEALAPQKVLEATSPPVLTQGMAAKMLKYLASVVPDKPEGKKKPEGKESLPWWTLPYQAYTYQGPKNTLPGAFGRIHEAIDPVKAYGGYGGVLGAAMMGPGLSEWHNSFRGLHGTLSENVPSIKATGISPTVGSTVEKAYGSEYANAGVDMPELVYMTPGDEPQNAITAMRGQVADKLGKSFHAVTPKDIAKNGALVVVRPDPDGTYVMGEDQMSTSLSGRKLFDYDNAFTAEPGDWYSYQRVAPTGVLKGNRLLNFIKRYAG